MLNFYRTPAYKQIEWTFPIEYKTLKWNQPSPETKAVMSLIDQTRPDLVFSLHNAAFSGVYFYVSNPCPTLYSKLQDLVRSEKLPLHLGEPETPYMKRLADAIFLLPLASEIYDFYEKHIEKDPITVLNRGTSAMEYAKRVCDAFTIICEMPYIYDQRISDTTLTSTMRREAVLKSVEISTKTFNLIKHHWNKIKGLLDPKSPFYEVLEDYQKRNIDLLAAKRKWAETNPILERPATASELFNSLVITKYYDMRWIGQLIRLIDQSKNKQSEEVLKSERRVLFEELLQLNSKIEQESKYKVIPIQKLVKVQVGTALNVATFLIE